MIMGRFQGLGFLRSAASNFGVPHKVHCHCKVLPYSFWVEDTARSTAVSVVIVLVAEALKGGPNEQQYIPGVDSEDSEYC